MVFSWVGGCCFLCWGMCQALLPRRMATMAWKADLQDKVSVSKHRLWKPGEFCHRVLRTSSLKQRWLCRLSRPWTHQKEDSRQSKPMGNHSALSSVASSLRWEMTSARLWLLCPQRESHAQWPSWSFFVCCGYWQLSAWEREDACGRSEAGPRIIVEGPVGTPWLGERSPDEAKLLKERGTFKCSTSLIWFKLYLKCTSCWVVGGGGITQVWNSSITHECSCPLLELYHFEVVFCAFSSWCQWKAYMVMWISRLVSLIHIYLSAYLSSHTLEKGMATHSSILAWEIPRTEEPGGLQSMGLQRVGHDWVANTHVHTHTCMALSEISN